MEKEALFRNIFRKYADDPKLPLFKHLFNTMDDEQRTIKELGDALYEFATDAWIATHDDLSIGGVKDFYAWWKDLDKSEWHERVKSWLKKVMGGFYGEYDIERRFQDPLNCKVSDPLSEMKVYLSVLSDSVGVNLLGIIEFFDNFLNPTSVYYDTPCVYVGVTIALLEKKRKLGKNATV